MVLAQTAKKMKQRDANKSTQWGVWPQALCCLKVAQKHAQWRGLAADFVAQHAPIKALADAGCKFAGGCGGSGHRAETSALAGLAHGWIQPAGKH
jgi:hypothetical protein